MVRGGRMGCSISWLSREHTFVGGFNPTKGALGHLARHRSERGVAIQLPKVDPVRVEDGQRSGLRLTSTLSGEGYFALVLAMECRQCRDAGPFAVDPSKAALRPTEATKAAVRYVRSTSTRAVR